MSDRKRYEESFDRILKTMRFEKTDRPAVIPGGNAVCAQIAGVSMADYCKDGPGTVDIHLKCWTSFKHLVDGIQCDIYSPHMLTALWLSNVKVAGEDLPENELWQVVEEELMTVDDYKKVIEGGYYNWASQFMAEKLHNPLPKIASTLDAEPAARERLKDAGIVPLVSAVVTTPFECFCGARGMVTFMKDLYKNQDMFREAMKVAAPEMLEANRQTLRRIKPLGVWVGGWRMASEMLAPKMWREFVWPYYKATVEMVIEEGVIPVLHLDSDWTRDLDFFKELPKHKCIMSPDGMTDIRKAGRVLDNHMAILGDVPAELLAFGSASEVKEYVKSLINDLGTGYMVGSGCDIPLNAKRENIEAMIGAAYEA